MRRNNLIIDAGMHVGHDTRFYLDKGFEVVAIEANPDLVATAAERFAPEIAEGRLRLYGVAIAENSGTAIVSVSEETELSTVSEVEATRARRHGIPFREVEVPAMRFEEILDEVGVPYYLKVDIEGLDLLCVRALRGFAERPRFISIESAIASADPTLGFDLVFEELSELWTLGYRRFKYVNQMKRFPMPRPHLEGSQYAEPGPPTLASGGFGAESPGSWKAVDRTLMLGWILRLQHELFGNRGRWAYLPQGYAYRALRYRLLHDPIGYFDLHAALD